MKINIKEVEIENGIVYHNGDKVDIYNRPLHEIFNPIDKVGGVLCKIDNYDKLPTKKYLDLVMMSKIYSKLYKCDIIEDGSYVDVAKDNFFCTGFNSITMLLGVDRNFVNPYKLEFDSSKLNKEEDGSYTLEGNVCVERNSRTSNYFRDVLIASNIEENMLIIYDECDHIEKLTDKFDNIDSYKFQREDGDDNTYEYIEKIGFEGLNNKYITELLVGEIVDTDKYLTNNLIEGKFSYDNPYLEVVQMYSTVVKKPELLFNELMSEHHSDEDVQYGLLNLGFNII